MQLCKPNPSIHCSLGLSVSGQCFILYSTQGIFWQKQEKGLVLNAELFVGLFLKRHQASVVLLCKWQDVHRGDVVHPWTHCRCVRFTPAGVDMLDVAHFQSMSSAVPQRPLCLWTRVLATLCLHDRGAWRCCDLILTAPSTPVPMPKRSLPSFPPLNPQAFLDYFWTQQYLTFCHDLQIS